MYAQYVFQTLANQAHQLHTIRAALPPVDRTGVLLALCSIQVGVNLLRQAVGLKPLDLTATYEPHEPEPGTAD